MPQYCMLLGIDPLSLISGPMVHPHNNVPVILTRPSNRNRAVLCPDRNCDEKDASISDNLDNAVGVGVHKLQQQGETSGGILNEL
jgi:hypothetical protein